MNDNDCALPCDVCGAPMEHPVRVSLGWGWRCPNEGLLDHREMSAV